MKGGETMKQLRKWLKKRIALVGLPFIAALVLLPNLCFGQTILISKYGFSPRLIYGQVNETCTLTIHNTDERIHNFVLRAFFIQTRGLKQGESVNVTFTPRQKGRYPFYSDAPGYPEWPFSGEIIIR
jgi:hypothetical protein